MENDSVVNPVVRSMVLLGTVSDGNLNRVVATGKPWHREGEFRLELLAWRSYWRQAVLDAQRVAPKQELAKPILDIEPQHRAS